MFDKYRGLILTTILISSFAYIGYRNEINITASVKKAIDESKSQNQISNLDNQLQALSDQSNAGSEQKESSTNLTPSQVEEIVKSYLVKNPEVITEALDKLQQTRMEELKKQVQNKISEKSSEIESETTPIVGNPNGTSKIVMFYDYNCGYCKQSYDALKAAMKKDNNIKIYLKIYPILGNDSEFLAKLMTAIHLNNPDKFAIIHDELLSDKVYSKKDLADLLKTHGLEFAKYESLIDSEKVATYMNNNMSLARELKINGVPTFIINGQYSPGFHNEDQLNEIIKSSLEQEKTETNNSEEMKEQNTDSNSEKKN